MTIDWSKAPEGATHWNTGSNSFYKTDDEKVFIYKHNIRKWEVSIYKPVEMTSFPFTPRPVEPKPYTRDEALQFLVERLDSWPTDIADAPLCPGWGWFDSTDVEFSPNYGDTAGIDCADFTTARHAFVPFVSVEDAPDMVNHPPHYQSDNGIECIDAIRAALGHDGFVSYCTGNVIKYLWRDKADRIEDLRKAAWYLNRAIQEVSGDAQTDR